MQVHYDFEGCEDIRNSVVTTGSFDGVHVGHRVIIQNINKLASECQGQSVLITFFPHPRKVLFPETAGRDLLMINTQREKIDLLAETGLDHLVIVTFTKEFSMLSPVDFVRNFLVKKLHLKRAVIGFNHHFGHNREGNYDYLHELGKYYNFEVGEIEEQEIQNETVSSTRIRKAIQDGFVQKANAYLDSFVHSKGEVLNGRSQLIHGILFYRQHIEEIEKLLPPHGLYAGSFVQNELSQKAVIYIRPNQDIGASAHCSALFFHLPEMEVEPLFQDSLLRLNKALLFNDIAGSIDEIEMKQAIEHTLELIY